MSAEIPLKNGGKLVRTNCFECHCKCGVLCEVDKDGNFVGVKGNPEDPRNEGRMCGKGLSAKQILHDPHRLRYPLKRAGERGEGKWDRVTWDEALDFVAEKIKKISAEYGAEAIAYGQGTGRGTNQWTGRSAYGGGRVHHSLAPGHVCLGPMLSLAAKQFGLLATFDGCDFDNADCIVFWGSNFVWTEGTFTSGQVGRSRDRGANLIVIDPSFEHPLAPKAYHFVGVRPGSDTYLAASWIQVIISEDLFDHEFVQKYSNAPLLLNAEDESPLTADMFLEKGDPQETLVWDRASGRAVPIHDKDIDEDIDFSGTIVALDGTAVPVKTVWTALKERVAPWTPEKAEELCWVPAKTIRDSARMYASAPSATISFLQGIEEQTNCKDSMQMINILIAITGNLEKEGGNLSRTFWNQMRGLSGKPPATQFELRMNDARASICGSYISNPTLVFEAMKTGKPYPVKGYIICAGNPLSWSENTAHVRECLKCLDLLVVVDYYMSPTCELADIVLPSAHWTERDYLADEVCSDWVFAQVKSVEPLYERKSDVTFWRELGRRVSPEWWPWETDEELFNWQLRETNAGVTWEELKEKWIHKIPDLPSREYKVHGFTTPTGRAELYVMALLRDGTDPLPTVSEPKQSLYATPALAREFPLTGVSGRRYPTYFHSSFRGIPQLRELNPYPEVSLHTSLAEELGIERGEWVDIESPLGRITMKARPIDGCDPRVCFMPHGWWQGCPELGLEEYRDGVANPNTIINNDDYNDEFCAPGMRSFMCRIVKKGGR